jgi:phosphatidylglycerol:prolipoprotein diacylglycerol transferase
VVDFDAAGPDKVAPKVAAQGCRMQGYIAFPDISPELFSISAFGVTFALRWYALAYIAGLLIGWRLVLRAIGTPALWRGEPPMVPEQLERLLTWVIMGVILGGRLGFVLFYQPGHYLSHPGEILKVWQGGMSFHGGFLGVVVASWLFFRAEKIPLLPAADLMALAAPVGLLLGRIANFINAELWGRATTMPWGVAFPGDAAQSCGQIVEVCARHPSQLYEAALEGLVLGLSLIWLIWRRGWLKRPGQITGLFLAGYGAARFFVEFFRQPDAQFVTLDNPIGLAYHIGGYGLTMGQTLSLPMILVGMVLMWQARRDPA